MNEEQLSLTLRRLRMMAGYTQATLAAEIGVHPITVLRWERGWSSPSREHLEAALAATVGGRLSAALRTMPPEEVRQALATEGERRDVSEHL